MSRSSKDGSVVEEKDPERVLKLKECCDLLLAGGYFRARIPTLSPFDKVVGGLAWSITASGVEVDVDVIFTENASIGQKIKTSDQIVKALVAMKCPYPLQSHQIQGLDYIHLFPIIQWLVRKVLEVRRLTGDLTRQLSVHQFSLSYRFPTEIQPDDSISFVGQVIKEYQPQRKYRLKHGAKFDSIERRTEATLLEYGEKIVRAAGGTDEEQEEKKKAQQESKGKNALLSKFDPTKSSAALEAKQKEMEEARRQSEAAESARYAAMQQQLADHQETSKLSGANVGNLVGRQSDEIKKAMAEYEEMKRKQEEQEASAAAEAAAGGKRGAEAAYQRQLESLKKKVATVEEQHNSKKQEMETVEQKYRELQATLAKKTAYVDRIHRESDKLSALESQSSNSQMLEKLKHLVALNEQLKQQEATFKESCLAQREQLLAMANSLEAASTKNSSANTNTGTTTDDPELRRMLEIERLYDTDSHKLERLRKVLAKKNMELSRLNRAMDEIPTRAELLQYEKRFMELYEYVANKLIETKKYYSMYNICNDSYSFMLNEKQLLDTIIVQYPLAMKSKAGKEQFLEYMQSVLTKLQQQQQLKKEALLQEQQKKEQMIQQCQLLLEKQRQYYKLVKEFQDECYKNEKLVEVIEKQSTASSSDSGTTTEG